MTLEEVADLARKDPPKTCGDSECRGCSTCDELYIEWLVKHGISVNDGYDWRSARTGHPLT